MDGCNSTWRAPGLAVVACVAVATWMMLPTANPTQQWAGTSSRVLQPTSVAVNQGRAQSALSVQKQQNVLQASRTVGTIGESQPHLGKVAAFACSSIFFLGVAVASARKFFTSTPSVALLAASSEKTSEKPGTSIEKMRKMVESLDSNDMRLISRGGSMVEVARSKGIDEVALAIRSEQASRKDLTPKEVILDMQRGNGRFWMGLTERPDMNAMQRRALIMAQAPRVCILSCSDSRVPVEIIFDQGLGEVFVVRMAGNVLDSNAHGSIEYAVKYLGVKVILVIGHEGCGAVKGAISMSADDLAKEPFDLQVVLQSIKSSMDVDQLNEIMDPRAREREAINLNTSIQVKKLQQNQLIAEKAASGTLLVCGAFYEISSGIVDFFTLDKNGLVIDI